MELNKIKYFDREYPIVYNINVMHAIQKKYKSLDKWGELMDAEETPIEDLLWVYKEMINEGIEIENDLKGENRSPVDEKLAGRIVSFIGVEEAGKTLEDVMTEATVDEEEEAKNE